jgi:Zn-dependent peptidase ImmA (M78 family)
MKLTPYQAYHQNQPKEKPKESYRTLKQLSKELGLSVQILNKRSWKLGLKGVCLGKDGTRYYTEAQINRIVSYLKPLKKVSSIKIQIIELYQNNMNGRYISKFMKISTVTTYDTIREYNETGFITIASKLNYE